MSANRDIILQAHTNSMRLMKQGLALDEQGDQVRAATLYQESVRLMLAGMAVDCSRCARDAADVKALSNLQARMSKHFDQVQSRLNALDAVVPCPPYAAFADDVSDQQRMRAPREADLILAITSGVRMFCTDSSGHVVEPAGPLALRVFLFPTRPDSNDLSETGAPAFVQCGRWVYPLIPGCSPIYMASPHSYTFPDVDEAMEHAGASGGTAYVTVVISHSVSPELVRRLEETLKTMANVQTNSTVSTIESSMASPAPSAPALEENGSEVAVRGDASAFPRSLSVDEEKIRTWSQKIANGLTVGAGAAVWALGKGAEVADKYIQKGAAKVRGHLEANETPAKVGDDVKVAVKQVKDVSSAAVVVSENVVTAVYLLTKVIGEQLGPVIARKVNEYTESNKSKDPTLEAKVEGATQVAGAALYSALQVYKGLETAARMVGRSASKATVETVHHRYGAEAGAVADDSLSAVGNVAVTTLNVRDLGIRAIAKRTAVQAGGSALTHTQEMRKQGQSNSRPALQG